MSIFVSLPRASGGVSGQVGMYKGEKLVFPARVGVFLGQTLIMSTIDGLPRASGGVSYGKPRAKVIPKSSPREWGCFYFQSLQGDRQTVFPARVGVFPDLDAKLDAKISLPRASGGVSRAYRWSALSENGWGEQESTDQQP